MCSLFTRNYLLLFFILIGSGPTKVFAIIYYCFNFPPRIVFFFSFHLGWSWGSVAISISRLEYNWQPAYNYSMHCIILFLFIQALVFRVKVLRLIDRQIKFRLILKSKWDNIQWRELCNSLSISSLKPFIFLSGFISLVNQRKQEFLINWNINNSKEIFAS